MNRLIICLAAVLVASIGLAQDKAPLKDQKDKASYSIGHDIGNTFKKQNVDINLDALISGMKDALAGKEALPKEERDKTLAAFQKELIEKQTAAAKAAGEKNAAEGEKFLAENKNKDGVKTTASGLQYKVLKEGAGESPKPTDMVITHYKGTLLDGTEFDSSYKKNEPLTIPANRVIPGWAEGLLLMKPGAKYQFFIPSKLAYGERGVRPDIGPNATLIFEVELIGIKPPDPTPTPPPPGAAIKPTAPVAVASITPATKGPSTPAGGAPPAPIVKPSPTPQKK